MASWPISSDKWKAPLVFIVATSEIFARLNNLLDGNSPFGGNVLKNPARYIF